jgi:hypothetical protein
MMALSVAFVMQIAPRRKLSAVVADRDMQRQAKASVANARSSLASCTLGAIFALGPLFQHTLDLNVSISAASFAFGLVLHTTTSASGQIVFDLRRPVAHDKLFKRAGNLHG